MNKIIKSVLIGLAFLPSLTLAVTAVGWNTPTPTTGWVLPNAINGTNQVIYAINGIFSTASSTFSSSFRLPTLSNGGLAVFNGLVSSGATTTAGTGLTYSGNAFNVNTSQNISTLSNLTSNGFVKTSGGTGALSIDTTAYTPTATTITVNGTTNQITSSAGAQDLSANRTWTLSFPTNVIFPSYASSTLGFSTPYASSTAGYFGTLGVSTSSVRSGYSLEVAGNAIFNDLAPFQAVTSPMQKAQNEEVVTAFQVGNGFTYNSGGGSSSADTSDYVIGTQSLKIITDSSGTQSRVQNLSIPSFSVVGKTILATVKVDKNFTTTDQLFIGFSSDNFTNYFYCSFTYDAFQHYYGGDWFNVSCSPSDYNTTGSPNLSAITAIRLYVRGATGTTHTAWFNKISLVPNNTSKKGVVSITFDDGSDGQYTYGLPVLATTTYNYPATAYIETDVIGNVSYMTKSNLDTLQNVNGWEIAAHYQTSFAAMTYDQQENAIVTTKNWLIKNGYGKGADSFAYPQGEAVSTTTLPLMRKYFTSARMSSDGRHETFPIGNPYALKVFPVKSTTATSTVYAAIDAAAANHDWLILVFHKIVPSGASISTEYNQRDLQYIADYLYASRNTIEVKTVNDVINRNDDSLVRLVNNNLGISSTTPWKQLSVGSSNTGTFAISTSTAGTLKISSTGEVYSDPSGGSGTPAGSNGQLQYNASGAFGGVSTTTASCTGSVSCTGFTIIGSSPITITGSGGSGGGLGTSTPWTYGNIVTAITDGNVTTISTSTLVNNIFPFNSFGNSTSSIFNFTNGLMAFSSTTLNGLKLSDLSQGALYVGSGAKVNSVATSTQTVGSSLSYTGTQGSMLGGSSGTLSLNTANPNTWSVLQTFNYSSSTAYSSFQNSSSTFSTIGTLTLSTTTAGTLKTNSSGLVWVDTSGGGGGVTSVTGTYPIISSGGTTPAISIAFSTTTANIWSALNTFNGGLTIGTTTAGILRTNSSGVVYASSATTTLPLLNAFSLPSNDSSYFSSTLVDFPTSISSQSIFVASSTTVQTGVMGAIHIPENFASSTAQVEIGWTATSTTGNIVARFQYVCTGGSNTTTYVKTAWAESTSTTVANPSTAGFKVETTLNINAGYYCSAGNTMQFYLSRDGSNSADTSVVPMEIYDTTINLLTQ